MEDEKPALPAHAQDDGVAPEDTYVAAAGTPAAEHTTTTSRPASPTDSTAAVGVATGALQEEQKGGSLPPEDSATAAPAGFVAPSSYLRPVAVVGKGKGDGIGSPMGASRPGTAGVGMGKAVHPLDREQIEGLVSAYAAATDWFECMGWMADGETACDQSLSQGADDV